MPRTVTAWLTHAGTPLGSVGPFAVGTPWWADVAPVVQHLEASLGVPVLVLRLMSVAGSDDGARDGHVTYHVEALERPDGPGRTNENPDENPAGDDHPLRLPWARRDGIEELLGWAGRHVEVAGRPEQLRTWNLAALFRIPTPRGPAWLKALPPFAADEGTAMAAIAAVDPGFVPEVIAAAPGRLLLAEVPGRDGWDASAAEVRDALRRLISVQAGLAGAVPTGLPDRRPEVLAPAVHALLDGPVGAELSPAELQEARALEDRWERLADCGLPDTLVHGDFHPGNWRIGAGPTVVLDLADAHLGNPVLDGVRAIDYLPPDRREAATQAWISAWTEVAPRSRPAGALRIAAPLAHLAYALRYQEFLDNIEPSERVYHRGDPAAAVRHALASARDPG